MLNKKIDLIVKQILEMPSKGKEEESAPFNMQDVVAEHTRIGDILIAGDDRLTYVTLVTEVH